MRRRDVHLEMDAERGDARWPTPVPSTSTRAAANAGDANGRTLCRTCPSASQLEDAIFGPMMRAGGVQ